MELRVFHDLELPRPVTHVRCSPPDRDAAQWCAVTGWTLASTTCPALARRVDDSGDGVAWLVSGGDAGLRLQTADPPRAWHPKASAQWGAPFLLLPDASDVRVA